MPDDPCAGLTGAELRHCLELQYANGYDQEKAAVQHALAAGLFEQLAADLILHALEIADDLWTKAIKKHGGGE